MTRVLRTAILALATVACLLPAQARAQTGTSALVYCGDSSMGCAAADLDRITAALTGAGASAVTRVTSMPSDLSAYRILFFFAPRAALTTGTLDRIANFHGAGGYVVAAAENIDFSTGHITQLNTIAARCGVSPGPFVGASEACDPDGDFNPVLDCYSVPPLDPGDILATDVAAIRGSCSSYVVGGEAFLEVNNEGIASVFPRFLALGDTQMLNDLCMTASLNNDTFLANIWAWANQNSPPTPRDDSFEVDEDAVLNADVLDNDSDPNGDALTARAASAPAHGALTLRPDGTFTYTPDRDFHGADSFRYEAVDRLGEATEALVSIAVRPTPDAPVARDDAFELDEDTPTALPVLANDSDPDAGDVLTVEVVEPPVSGSALVLGDQRVQYVPGPHFHGADSFTYRATDSTGRSATATVELNVRPVNDAPQAFADELETDEDTPLEIALRASDPDFEVLTFSASAPLRGALAELDPAAGTVRYIPPADFHGVDVFRFEVRDAAGARSEADVTVVVLPVNDPPTARSTAVTTAAATPVAFAFDSDDIDSAALTHAVLSPPARGALSDLNLVAGTGIYTPETGFSGVDTIAWQVSDGELTAAALVRITVGATGGDPVADSAEVRGREDTPLPIALGAFDPEGEPIGFVIADGPESGELIGLDATGGTLTYVPAPDFFGADSFTFFVTAGDRASATATVSITVSPVNDPPVADSMTFDVAEDTPTWVRVTASDVDSETLLLRATNVPALGRIADTDAAAFSFLYVPDADVNGLDEIRWRANDGVDDSAEAVVQIRITPENDPPLLLRPADGAEFFTDAGTALRLVAEGSDVDDDALSYAVEPLPPGATLNPETGEFEWTPTAFDAGSREVVVTVTDGTATASAQVTLTVAAPDSDGDGIPDEIEDGLGTDPDSADTDNDRISDADEIGDDWRAPINSDGDDLPDFADTDSDNDGLDDADEAGDADLNTPPVDTDGDGLPDYRDPDSDDDGVEDQTDNCRLVANRDQADLDEDGLGDDCDADADGDGVADDREGDIGLDPTRADSDGDTISDFDELGSVDSPLDTDDDDVIDALDEDSDDDGVPDRDEAGDSDLSTPPVDTDGDGSADYVDPDSDDDGVEDGDDNCRIVFNPEQRDDDANGIGDACDNDEDGDGVVDGLDNCPGVENADQYDVDEDGVGDACDSDNDGDGVADVDDNCPDVENPDQADADADGIGDDCDDADNRDPDGDGVPEDTDNCPDVANPEQSDLDRDGIGDDCDPDADGDDVIDLIDDCIGLSDLCGGGTGSSSESGCGCRSSTTGVPVASWLVALVCLGLWGRGRRRRIAA